MSDAKAKAITIMPSDEALWDAVKFVAIALRETPYGTRYGLDMIKVRGNKQFAVTDGRCLHMAKCDHELSAGLYDVLANTEQAVVLRRNDNPTKLFVDDKTIDGAEPESTHAFDIRWAENDIPIGAQIQFVVAANGGPCLNPQ